MRLIKLPFEWLIYGVLKLLLSLRYRIEVIGLDKIDVEKKKGLLFLPNHPAEIDPVILISILWGKYRPRPLIIENFYFQKGIRFMVNLILRPLPLPSMETGNEWKRRQVEKLKGKILESVTNGDHFLIYPSGRLKTIGEEKIGGASLIHQLLQQDKDLKLVLVKTTGLWGSSFSRAITGFSPDFGKVLWEGTKAILKSGIFFLPRRKVVVEFAMPDDSCPREGEKKELNEWLENWYNRNGTEPLTQVSMSIWKDEFPNITAHQKEDQSQVVVPEEIKVQILGFLSKLTNQSVTNIHGNLHLSNDLGLDSLDVAQIYVFLEESYGISHLTPGQLQTVRDIMQAAAGEIKEGEKVEEKKKRWPKETLRPPVEFGKGETIQEVFINNAERMANSIACADALSGNLSYRKLKRAALVLSLEIQKMKGDHIGILLPSSVGAYVAILATLLAGKTPVMLNWTTGSRNLEHAAKVCSLQTVLSSFRFLSRLDHCNLGTVDDLVILLEKLRDRIPLRTKLKGVFLSMRGSRSILKRIGKISPNDTAVVIFTSGTETLPKGVPLTHKNILSNQKAALTCATITKHDSLYGVLPPFHSFGFSVTGLFPLLTGVKVCYAPDPTNSKGMANDIDHWEPTLFCCAPGFIQSMLRACSDEQIESLRLIVSGAEKAPKELYDTLHAKQKSFIEGYGISECSPVVTIQRENEKAIGVGKPLPNITLMVIDIETEKPLEKNEEGEICIHGPSVFNGYIGVDKNPFIEVDSKRWYRSGDRGKIDQEGNLIITGRLTRFIKIGGEMISLGGLEQDILEIGREQGWIPNQLDGAAIAVTGKDTQNEKPTIVVFSPFEMDLEQLNQALKAKGHGRLVRIGEVRKVEEIPVTGTGKVHYRLLDEML